MVQGKGKTKRTDRPRESGTANESSQAGGGENNQTDTALREDEATARREMIAVAAYYLAERRGFCPGAELDDWKRAEEEIARQFAEPSADNDAT